MTNARTWAITLLTLLGAVVLLFVWQQPSQPPAAIAAPNVFGGPVNGGCYLDTPISCKLHIDAWQPLQISPGEKLLAFQLQATGHTLYDFRTDVSNPPSGSYLPSLVKQDFAITCGETYVLSLLAQDTGDANLLTLGQTNAFTCPAEVPFEVWIPAVWR